ncbi:MAG: GH92 family glycosyl hydrolase, partial [Rikenellaceae bacterium]
MRKIILSSIVALGSLSLFAQSNTQYINTFVGSIKMGHTFPGACVPHGIVQLSPDTDTIAHNINGVYQTDVYKYCAGYQYSDSTIVGFSHTHLSGTGHSDLGDILIMPFTGEVQFNPGTSDNPDSGYRSRFDHSTESSQAGYYAVTLSDDDIKAELTATSRVGVHRYSYPSGATPKILLDLTHGIYNYDGKVLWSQLRVENDTLLTGYRITNGWSRTNYTYFAISLSKPIVSYGADDRKSTKYNGWWRKFDISKGFPEMGAPKLVAFFEFEDDGKPLELKVALSAVSTNGALANLEAEALNHTFDYLVADAHNRWAEEIDIIEVEGSDEKKTMLYTSLYHTLINPSEYMDVTGEYRGVDHNIHKSNDFVNYTIFSLWDTYRTLHPLYTLLNRERNSDIVESMLSHHDQSVHKALPIWSHMGNENWCMIGYHGVSVVGDMAIKDDNSIDKKRALDAMINSSNVGYYDGIDFYKENGYVPYEINSSGSSITLEYAYDDWVIYYLASKIGDTHTSQQYKERAYNYKNVYDKSIGFARARLSNGQWKEDVNLLNTHWQGFIEGNSWNYSFYVPHDVNGMIELMGGDERFVSRLDSLFTMEL